MEGRNRIPMTSGVGVTYHNCNPELSEHWAHTRFEELKNCQTCTNPTKYIFGLWDGKNGTHGQIFECRNYNCESKQNRLRDAVITEEEKKLVVATNEGNGIFVNLIKERRKELGITIMKMSQGLGISPSVYSNYEMCRVAVPLEIKDRIEAALSAGNYMNEILTKYGRNNHD